MKIIKQGIPPEKRECIWKCYKCKTEVEYLVEESKVFSDFRDGDSYTVLCPTCKSIIYGKLK